jgi:squalene synthase HpnC
VVTRLRALSQYRASARQAPLVTASARSDLDRAYALCTRMAREHYENFPVASYLLPRSMRPAMAAIYAFARRADDFADEPGLADAERLWLLDEWHARLRRAHETAPVPTFDENDLIFLALHDAMSRHQLPVDPFEDLLSAFRQDVTTKRYHTWSDVLDYCRRSANPVGRLVLRVAGYRDERLDRASDALCTALQLANFWQDFARDWSAGRLYIPLADRDASGARDSDLDAGRLTVEWRRAFEAVTRRTRELFAHGRPICEGVRGRLRWELRLTWLGGSRILEKLEQSGFDVFRQRPTIGASDGPLLAWRALTWHQ